MLTGLPEKPGLGVVRRRAEQIPAGGGKIDGNLIDRHRFQALTFFKKCGSLPISVQLRDVERTGGENQQRAEDNVFHTSAARIENPFDFAAPGFFKIFAPDTNRHRHMRYLQLSLILLVFSALAGACVKPKIYRAEIAARSQAEGREKVLLQELIQRREESANLIKQVGDLNRTIGSQNEEMNDLRAELNNRTKQMGESSSKLSGQLSQLENELAAKNSLLDQRTATLQKVQTAQKERRRRLNELKTKLTQAFGASSGVQVDITPDEAVSVSLPDKTLFNADATTVSASGKTMLKPLADLLGEHPEYDVEIIAYTDNSLPKDKSLKDTWDWSLIRATNIVRLMIRDYNTNANQLTPIGRGEFYPVTSNATPEGRLANRRTIVLIHPALPAVPAAE